MKSLFAKWEDRAKELDDVFYTEWSDEIDAEIVLAEARKDIREELDDQFYRGWAAH